MARYKTTETGVYDRDTGTYIPADNSNLDYLAYLDWVAEGNTADPEFTQAELDAQAIVAEVAQLKIDLQKAMVWQFRLILALFQVGQDKAVWAASDFDQELRDKAAAWKTKSDRLLEIDK